MSTARPILSGGTLVMAMLFALRTGAATPEMRYRLAGVIASSPENCIALIELPDGRQRLFHRGDAFADGRIREVTATRVIIDVADGELWLTMRHDQESVHDIRLAPASVQEVAFVDADPDLDHSDARNQELSASDAARLLAAADSASQQLAHRASVGAHRPHSRLNELLELPDDARIVAVDEVSVHTTQDAIEAFVPRLNQSQGVRLTVVDGGEVTSIHLTLDREQ